MDKKRNLELAEKLIDKLSQDELFSEVCIYANGKRFRTDGYLGAVATKTPNGNTYYVEKGEFDPSDYIDYCNAETITVSFEGPLYDMINYEDFDYIFKLSKEILGDYGLYFEQGDTWNMSAYTA